MQPITGIQLQLSIDGITNTCPWFERLALVEKELYIMYAQIDFYLIAWRIGILAKALR